MGKAIKSGKESNSKKCVETKVNRKKDIKFEKETNPIFKNTTDGINKSARLLGLDIEKMDESSLARDKPEVKKPVVKDILTKNQIKDLDTAIAKMKDALDRCEVSKSKKTAEYTRNALKRLINESNKALNRVEKNLGVKRVKKEEVTEVEGK